MGQLGETGEALLSPAHNVVLGAENGSEMHLGKAREKT